MTQLPRQFASYDDPDLKGGFTLINEGDYKAVLVQSGELTDNKAKSGKYILSKIVIVEGQYQHTEFDEYFNVINQNKTAENMAFKKIADISKAVGLPKPADNMLQVQGKPFMIKVVTEKAKKYDKVDPLTGEVKSYDGSDKSVIKEFFAVPPVGFAGQPQAFAPVAPVYPAPPVPPPGAQYQPAEPQHMHAAPHHAYGHQAAPQAAPQNWQQPQPTPAPANPSWMAPPPQQGA